MEDKKLITQVEFKIKPEFIEEVLSLARAIKTPILQEDTCENFFIHRKTDEPGTFVIWGIYTSEAAYAWHNEQEYVTNFFASLKEKLEDAPKISRLEEF